MKLHPLLCTCVWGHVGKGAMSVSLPVSQPQLRHRVPIPFPSSGLCTQGEDAAVMKAASSVSSPHFCPFLGSVWPQVLFLLLGHVCVSGWQRQGPESFPEPHFPLRPGHCPCLLWPVPWAWLPLCTPTGSCLTAQPTLSMDVGSRQAAQWGGSGELGTCTRRGVPPVRPCGVALRACISFLSELLFALLLSSSSLPLSPLPPSLLPLSSPLSGQSALTGTLESESDLDCHHTPYRIPRNPHVPAPLLCGEVGGMDAVFGLA